MEQQSASKMVIRERAIAAILTVLGLYSLVYALITSGFSEIQSYQFLLAVFLAGAIILAHHYPIHLLRGTKASIINVPIFLTVVLMPAPLAILTTGAGLLTANLLARQDCGLLPRDIASTVGQWMSSAFCGYYIIHQDFPGIHITRLILLFFCAITFLLLDFLIFSLSQSITQKEPFYSTLKFVVREGITIEAIQYLIAILGALAVDEDIWSLALLIVPISITYVAFKNIKETHHETIQILEDMADTVDLRDINTGGHSKQVTNLVHEVLNQLSISGPEAIIIETAARLHDIGKIGIPDSILMKAGKLLPEEMAVMQTHSQKGAELIQKYKDFSRGAVMILHHHERWDGGGYPAGLSAYEIPFGARIIAVADSFDAMTSDRPYRKAMSTLQALRVLQEGCGSQWDPQIVNAFVELMLTRVKNASVGENSVENQHATLCLLPQKALVSLD